MTGAEIKGTIMDLTDGTAIMVHWPEKFTLSTELSIVGAPTQYRNSVSNAFESAKDVFDVELILMEEISTVIDVMIPLRWLQCRQLPGIVPGVGVVMGPARLAFFGTQIIPPGSEWEIVSGIRLETEGSLELSTGHPRRVNVSFTCHRVDERASKFSYS